MDIESSVPAQPVEEAALCAPRRIATVSPKWVGVAVVQFCIILVLGAMLALSLQGLVFWKAELTDAKQRLITAKQELKDQSEQIRNWKLSNLSERIGKGSRSISDTPYDLLTALRDADYLRYQQSANQALPYESATLAFGQ